MLFYRGGFGVSILVHAIPGATPTRVFAFGRVPVNCIKTRPKPKRAVGVAPGGHISEFHHVISDILLQPGRQFDVMFLYGNIPTG